MLGKLGGEIWWENLHLPLVGKIKFFPTTSEIWWEMVGKRIFWWEKVALPRGYAHFPHHFSHRFPVGKKNTASDTPRTQAVGEEERKDKAEIPNGSNLVNRK